jgi:hypothetical protein
MWENWSTCREKLGDIDGARAAMTRALSLAEARADTVRLIRFHEALARLEPSARPGPG